MWYCILKRTLYLRLHLIWHFPCDLISFVPWVYNPSFIYSFFNLSIHSFRSAFARSFIQSVNESASQPLGSPNPAHFIQRSFIYTLKQSFPRAEADVSIFGAAHCFASTTVLHPPSHSSTFPPTRLPREQVLSRESPNAFPVAQRRGFSSTLLNPIRVFRLRKIFMCFRQDIGLPSSASQRGSSA